jgi:hypothetical protein
VSVNEHGPCAGNTSIDTAPATATLAAGGVTGIGVVVAVVVVVVAETGALPDGRHRV